ncbi:MAG: hypothetical protein KGI54_13260 [Pseudomonadota bacterium]|nr:hypothetical protein [Pseudomonadota bacterium]
MNDEQMEWTASWIAALESGEYCQTTGALRKDGGYCCMGVAADLLNPMGWRTVEGKEYWQDAHMEAVPYVEIKSVSGLPLFFLFTLPEMNDEGHDFLKIAQTIRERAGFDTKTTRKI